ncbi:MAG: hypothetical protein QF886_26755, partial [Planctomycetota bacterium]|nr:hypothetical protein [Planctomycetota bacterium]
HPVLLHPLDLDRFPLLSGQGWGSSALWRAWGQALDAEGKVFLRLKRIAQSHENQFVREQANLMLMMLEQSHEPISKNPSFEQGQNNWGLWVKWGIGSMKRVEGNAHKGKFSILCKGMKRGGPHQEFAITPGRYGAVAFAHCPEAPNGNATVELSMTLRNAEGRTLMPSPSVTITPSPGKWLPLAIAGDIPEKIGKEEVKKVLLIIIVNGFEPGEEVYIDDLAMFPLSD